MIARPVLIAAVLWASAAAAQAPAPQAPPPQTPAASAGDNTVAGVAVTAGQPPVVVSTYPAKDAKVAPGVLVMKVTFDQAMEAGHWSYGKAAAGDRPDCLNTPRLLGDGKTFVLLCTLAPGKTYGVALNDAADRGFASAGDRRAARYDLPFSTSSAEPVRSLKDAMKAAGLSDVDMPVESGLPKAGP